MNADFKRYLLDVTKAKDCNESEVIQSLWSGYGKISRYVLIDSPLKSVVVKHISPNLAKSHPRGWNTVHSYRRKVKSYEIETYWYKHWNQLCQPASKTPSFIGLFKNQTDKWIVMEDLNSNFPLRKNHLKINEAEVCLKWLANFHAQFLGEKPKGLWKTGTYWHLKTRRDEFERIKNHDLKQKAHLIDEALNQCQYQTIVHGDAKVANFCFSKDCKKVAAVDFQYVGGGCGMKDVAYFLGSCLLDIEYHTNERELLNFYFAALEKAVKFNKPEINTDKLIAEWRRLYPFASADFTRFLLGWMPSHEKINTYSSATLNTVLNQL